MSKNVRPHLSKGILQMKFMQRTKVKIDQQNAESEGRTMYAKEISEKMLNTKTNFIAEPSFVYCEGLQEGRFSFRGMNPEIERLLELEKAERDAANRQEQPTEVTDREMAAFYHKTAPATVTLERKFQHKKDQIKRHSTPNSEETSSKKRIKTESTDIKEEKTTRT